MRKKFLGLLSIAVAKIRKVSQNAIFLSFIYSNFVLFYAYPVFYKRLAVYLGRRSNGFPQSFMPCPIATWEIPTLHSHT